MDYDYKKFHKYSMRRLIAKRYKNIDILVKKAKIPRNLIREFMEEPSNSSPDFVYSLADFLEFEITEEEEDSGSEWW